MVLALVLVVIEMLDEEPTGLADAAALACTAEGPLLVMLGEVPLTPLTVTFADAGALVCGAQTWVSVSKASQLLPVNT